MKKQRWKVTGSQFLSPNIFTSLQNAKLKSVLINYCVEKPLKFETLILHGETLIIHGHKLGSGLYHTNI